MIVIASVNCQWVELDVDGDDVFYTRQLASWNLINTRTSELNSARRRLRNIIEYVKRINFEEVQQDLQVLRAVLRPPSLSGQVRPPVINTVQEERYQLSLESTERPTRSMEHDDDSEDSESGKNEKNDDTEENEGGGVGQNDRAVIQYFPDELSNLHSEGRPSSS